MSQQMHSLVQSERGLQQVVLYHFTPRFFHQFMKHNTLCKEASLQFAEFGTEIAIRRELVRASNSIPVQPKPSIWQPLENQLCFQRKVPMGWNRNRT